MCTPSLQGTQVLLVNPPLLGSHHKGLLGHPSMTLHRSLLPPWPPHQAINFCTALLQSLSPSLVPTNPALTGHALYCHRPKDLFSTLGIASQESERLYMLLSASVWVSSHCAIWVLPILESSLSLVHRPGRRRDGSPTGMLVLLSTTSQMPMTFSASGTKPSWSKSPCM